jgi:hypothetical protein
MGLLPFRLPEDPDSRFALLERRAIGALEDAVHRVPSHLVPSFRLWHYPPVGPWISWVLFVPPELDFRNGEARVRALRWDADGDKEKIALSLRRRPSGNPSIVEAEAPLEPGVVEQLFRLASECGLVLREILPSYARPTLTEFGIEGYVIRSRPSRVEWGRPVPPGLGVIAAWYSRARAAFENAPRRDL